MRVINAMTLAILIGFMIGIACSPGTQEPAPAQETTIEFLVSQPEPGVRCYRLKRVRPLDSPSISCVARP